ncbi:MAG: tetratricopeptide repeat protein [Steroidobacteraceae bacterium]
MAVLAADVAGYSRLMTADDEGTLAALRSIRAIFDQLVAEFDGRVFGSVGDSLMAQFPSAVNALRCAQAIQHAIGETNEPLPAQRRMQLRIGIDLGDVIDDGSALYGDVVNIAARLQALAEPGGILVSGAVHSQLRQRFAARFVDVGARAVKNIAEPVRTYAVRAPAAPQRWRRLIAFLRHRGVLVALAYVAASVLAVRAFGLIAPAAAPPWLAAAVVTVLALGLVPAIAYAWRFDARFPVPRWARATAVVMATVVSVAVVTWVWREHWRAMERNAISRPAVQALPVVAVVALRNLTGEARHDWLSEGLANLVRDGLSESKQLVVVSPTRWQAVARTAGGRDTGQAVLLTAAGRAGIGYVLTGEFLSTPEGMLLSVRLSDVDHGIELGAHRAPGLTPQTLLGESSRVVLLAKRALGVPYAETYESFAADFAVGNMAAYESYLAGIAYFFRFDYRAAARSYRAALDLAPDFHMARYRLAHAQVASGDTAGALATLAAIPDDARLTRRERLYVDGARALFARDGARAKSIFRNALAEFPYDLESRYMLVLAYDVSFEDDAAIAQLRRMLQQEPQNDRVWTFLAETYLRLGDYGQTRDALDHYLALQPDDPHGFTILGQLAQFEGDPAGAQRAFRRALELLPEFAPARLALAQSETVAGDWTAAGSRLAALAADPEAPMVFRIDAGFALNGLRLAQGRFAAAIEPLRRLTPGIQQEEVRVALSLVQQARAQAERGKFPEAAALVEKAIGQAPGYATRYLFARGTLARLRGQPAGLRAAAAAIRDQEIAGTDQFAVLAREDAARAAAFLDGVASLSAGDAEAAVERLTQVAAMPGYQYASYDLALAQALFESGRGSDALARAREAAAWREPGDLRLDLELDRTRALLLEAEILAASGRRAQAAERAREFLRRWQPDDPAQAERVRAERLAGEDVNAARAAPGRHRPTRSS